MLQYREPTAGSVRDLTVRITFDAVAHELKQNSWTWEVIATPDTTSELTTEEWQICRNIVRMASDEFQRRLSRSKRKDLRIKREIDTMMEKGDSEQQGENRINEKDPNS